MLLIHPSIVSTQTSIPTSTHPVSQSANHSTSKVFIYSSIHPFRYPSTHLRNLYNIHQLIPPFKHSVTQPTNHPPTNPASHSASQSSTRLSSSRPSPKPVCTCPNTRNEGRGEKVASECVQDRLLAVRCIQGEGGKVKGKQERTQNEQEQG